MNDISKPLLRYSLAALFLWFGWQQLADPALWIGFLPEWTAYFPVPGEMIVRLNGWLEIVGAFFLIIGIFTKLAAWILGLHLLAIALATGGALGVRDGVLALACFSLALASPDHLTLEKRLKN